MGFEFETRSTDVDEIYPDELQGAQISDYLAELKADSLSSTLGSDEILITSDTVVWHKGISHEKPTDGQEAFEMLKAMNNDTHQVITSVCFTTKNSRRLEHSITEVTFANLTDAEIRRYIHKCKPFDKAGGYAIQEWIGLIGIKEIKGSYNNVVGLPTQLVYKTLMDMVG